MTPPVWDARFAGCSTFFYPLGDYAALLPRGRWPRSADLQDFLDRHAHPVTSGGGARLTFVDPESRPREPGLGYESRIFLHGEVEIRSCDYHDLFNALVWCAFPRAKAALNRRHYRALAQEAPPGNRGPARDALTLLDESGVIVASCDPELLALLREFRWKELFWERRARAAGDLRCFLFGHALYEKARRPYVGLTGHAVLLEIGSDFLSAPLARQRALLDAALAAHLDAPAGWDDTRALAPLPVLGVPGWWPGNELEAFYDNAAYFRPGRRRLPLAGI
jgi:hypothetical protein